MTADQLSNGQIAEIQSIKGDPAIVQRLAEFGLFDGEIIELIGRAPLGDPIEILVGETRLSLRKSEAAGILVKVV